MSKRKTIIEIKEEFNKIHDNKYDYSLLDENNYVNSSSKLPIICHCKDENGNEHGIFYQDRNHHLRGHGCPKCSNSGIKYTNETFIKKVSSINDNLLFDKCNYVNSYTDIIVGCNKHGYFKIRPYLLLQNHGCPYCGNERGGLLHRLNTDEFINRANIVHNNKYDYSKTNYVTNNYKVIITCKIHGDFLQSPSSHLNGCGCPICKESKLENTIGNYFKYFEREKTFEWLKYQSNLYLDFYDKDKNIAIECQGKQHFYNEKNYFEDIKIIQKRDLIKYNLCKEHNIIIIYYFPKEFLKYECEFYNDKICCHSINEIKNKIKEIL